MAIPRGLWDLISLTRGWTRAQQWKCPVLITGPPGNSHHYSLKNHLVLIRLEIFSHFTLVFFFQNCISILSQYTWPLRPKVVNYLILFCAFVLSPLQPSPALGDPWDCSLPGSSVHRTLQARILAWVAMPFSRDSSWPRAWTLIS